jgi:hypothetical protein
VSEATERLLRRAYEGFNVRDIEGALATMPPDHSGRFAGARTGR